MTHNCENCKFHDFDYEWDNELDDEVGIEVCEKGHKLLLHLPFKCPYFKKSKPKPYVEKFTECDNCEYVKSCESNGYVINCTNGMDGNEHFIKGRNAYCQKENRAFEDKKLSEIIEIVEQANDPQCDGNKKILQKAIELFGDITYKEFAENKIIEMNLREVLLND